MLAYHYIIRNLAVLQLLLPMISVFGAYYRCARDRVPCGCSYTDVDTMARIINGEDTLPYSWSMMVTVRLDRGPQHSCGGTIITDSHVLTAASCVQRAVPDSVADVSIAGGLHFLAEKSSTVRQVDAIYIHPKWTGGLSGFANDIAILHLSNPLNFTGDPYIARACIPQRDPSIEMTEYPRNGTRLVITGWGYKKLTPQSEMTQTMQQATIQAIHHEDFSCADSIYDARLQFCAGLYEGGKGPCIGDVGGPIMEWDEDHWNQVGIVSYTPMGCATAAHQAIYTRLAVYANWIQSILRRTNHTLSTAPPIPSTTPNIDETTTISPVTETPKVYQCERDSVQCGCGENNVELNLGKVVGGHEAIPYSWSMIVSLRRLNSNTHFCGGSILNENFILTAAHCVDTQSINATVAISVAAGIHDQFESNQTIRQVDRIIIHPGWDSLRDHRHDIAVLHLSQPLDLSNNYHIYPTCVPYFNTSQETLQYPPKGTQLLVIGWGALRWEDDELPDKLQQVEVFAIDNNDPICNNSIDDSQIQFCAGLHGGVKDSCQGDSGGPILQWKGNHWQQVGITSYGERCAEAGYPGIYTRLAYYTSWIESVINASLTTTTRSTEVPTTATTITTKPPSKYSCNKNASCGCGLNDVAISLSRIVGGEDAVPFSWSMIVSIRLDSNGDHACGGTILTESYILTAAHCVGNIESNSQYNIFVAAGMHNQLADTPLPMIRRVRHFFVHPNWKKGTPGSENDIALLELVRPLDIGLPFRTARTCLPQLNSSIEVSQYPPNNTRLMVIGWGAIEFGSFFSVTETLQQAQIFLVDNNDPTCNATMKNPQSQLCAGLVKGGKGTCQGDSGGPIFQWMEDHWEQVGLTSYARGCAREGHPAVFTRLAYFHGWIQSIINPPLTTTMPRPIIPTVYQCHRRSSDCGCSMANVSLGSNGIKPNKIVGGEEAYPYSWSMVVFLRSVDGNHTCGGTILSDWHILTAAHCHSAMTDYRHIIITAGVHQLSQTDAIERGVTHVSIHPSYSNNSQHLHDIAILHLDTSLGLDRQPRLSIACIPMSTAQSQNYPTTDAMLVAVGWGVRKANSNMNSNALQQILLKAIDITDTSCPVSIDNERYQFCADSTLTEGDVCPGDSGGPIFLYENNHWVQVGIIAHRQYCKQSANVGTFIRLAPYFSWIQEVMGNVSVPTRGPTPEVTSTTTTINISTTTINTNTTTSAAIAVKYVQKSGLMSVVFFLFFWENLY